MPAQFGALHSFASSHSSKSHPMLQSAQPVGPQRTPRASANRGEANAFGVHPRPSNTSTNTKSYDAPALAAAIANSAPSQQYVRSAGQAPKRSLFWASAACRPQSSVLPCTCTESGGNPMHCVAARSTISSNSTQSTWHWHRWKNQTGNAPPPTPKQRTLGRRGAAPEHHIASPAPPIKAADAAAPAAAMVFV